ncbi:oxidoreductase C-terminal domain-containing protein [Rhizobium sp. 2YAF20]|uniref:oxidoreductase C-terminal domain-containing protein n=1 Tax=Rhizobium sp. 2YAF20 TaxID=3233027 RepID=UPI003F94B3D2
MPSGVPIAGDCASFSYRGERIRIESVPHAIGEAEHVAGNILGAGRSYRPRPWFWSDQYSTKLQIAGFNRGYDRAAISHGTAERSMRFPIFRKNGCSRWAASMTHAASCSQNASLAFETALKVQSLPQWRSVGPQRRWLTLAAV